MKLQWVERPAWTIQAVIAGTGLGPISLCVLSPEVRQMDNSGTLGMGAGRVWPLEGSVESCSARAILGKTSVVFVNLEGWREGP